ncbi:MAG: hypothetical protein JRI32_01225 [Deltaproteobacteria bacterium]|nr:hypothetical protein [Deltaproteobacteria bacterium]
MIDKTKIIDTVIGRLKKLPNGHYIDIRTYKRNRSVVIVKKNTKELCVIENGFSKERFNIKAEKLKKLLKTLLKKEFPRSHKVRLYVMGEYSEAEVLETKRKTI